MKNKKYHINLFYGYQNHEEGIFHAFHAENPTEHGHEDEIAVKLAQLLDTQYGSEDFDYDSMYIEIPASVVEQIKADAVNEFVMTVDRPGTYEALGMVECSQCQFLPSCRRTLEAYPQQDSAGNVHRFVDGCKFGKKRTDGIRKEKKRPQTEREKFIPDVGATYPLNGYDKSYYQCVQLCADSPYDAHMVNTVTGWSFVAHGLGVYPNGTIDWDYSTGGNFQK